VHTIIDLGNSNCSWCLSAMAEHLRANDLVGEVRINASTGCLEADHDFDDPASVIATITQNLRGSVQASNGESVLVALHPHVASECPWRPVSPRS
jgi:hypothetical protein